MPKTKRTALNRNTGQTDKKEEHIYWNNHWAKKWVDDQPSGSYQITRNVMGDEFDAFNFGYNELITPWSNPSTYVDENTNISIQLYNPNGDNITVKAFTTLPSAIALPPSKPPLGWNPAKDVNSIQYGWIYLAWGATVWDGQPIEPDIILSELQRKIGDYGNWQTVYSGANRSWSDHSITYDLSNGNTNVYFRVRFKDNQGLWSVWSDIYDTKAIAGGIGSVVLDKSYNANKIHLSENNLLSNYPNPFNPTTTITYSLKDAGLVNIKVYDILGSEVAELVNENKEAGYYSLEFDASNLPSGFYIYKLQAGNFVDTKKMILLK